MDHVHRLHLERSHEPQIVLPKCKWKRNRRMAKQNRILTTPSHMRHTFDPLGLSELEWHCGPLHCMVDLLCDQLMECVSHHNSPPESLILPNRTNRKISAGISAAQEIGPSRISNSAKTCHGPNGTLALPGAPNGWRGSFRCCTTGRNLSHGHQLCRLASRCGFFRYVPTLQQDVHPISTSELCEPFMELVGLGTL